jgi:hypothetical protein
VGDHQEKFKWAEKFIGPANMPRFSTMAMPLSMSPQQLSRGPRLPLRGLPSIHQIDWFFSSTT